MFQIGFSFKNRQHVQFRKNGTVKISCLITFHSCPHNYTRICWCTIETSSDLLRSSSAIFGNLRKMFGNVHMAFGTNLENLWKSFESGRKSSENHQKRASSARLHYTLARRYEFYVLVVRSLVRYNSCHSNMKFISSRHRVISSMTEQCPITD